MRTAHITHTDPAAIASALNRLLGLPDPNPASPLSKFFGDFGCRWDDDTEAWVTILPHRLKNLTHRISQKFEAGGASVFVSKEPGAGVKITASISFQ